MFQKLPRDAMDKENRKRIRTGEVYADLRERVVAILTSGLRACLCGLSADCSSLQTFALFFASNNSLPRTSSLFTA